MSNSNFFTARGNPLRVDSFGESERLDPVSAGALDVIGNRLYKGEVQSLERLNKAGVTQMNNIIAEDEGPGVLNYLWFALGDGGTNGNAIRVWSPPLRIAIYIDDSTTPAIACSFRDFFNGFGLGRGHSLPTVGISRADQASGGFGAYRYLFCPYQKYLRVEIQNLDTVNQFATWTHANVTRLSDRYQGRKKLFQLGNTVSENVDIFSPGSIHTVTAPAGTNGLIESVSFGWQLAQDNNGNDNPFEGNISYYERANDVRPAWETTGGEDFGNGAFGYIEQQGALQTVTTGPASAGTAHTHDVSFTPSWFLGFPAGFVFNGFGNVWTYRFFQNEILRYFDGFKWIMPIGQVGQYVGTADTDPSVTRDKYNGTLNVFYHADQYPAIRYPVVNETLVDTANGKIPDWWTVKAQSAGVTVSNPNRYQVQGVAAGGTRGFTFELPSTLGGTGVMFEVECTVRLTGATAGFGANSQHQAFMGVDGTNVGGVYTPDLLVATGVEVFGVSDFSGPTGNEGYVRARTGNEITGQVLANRGEQIVGANAPRVHLKVRKISSAHYATYWKLENDPFWQPLVRNARRTNHTNNRVVHFGVWDNSSAVYENFKVSRLGYVTS
jgi:hypothetical protein